MRTFVREIKYQSPQYMRVQLAPVRREGGRECGSKKREPKPTSEVQAALNARNAARMITDIIHLNYTPEDYTLTPTYRDDCRPATAKEGLRNMINFRRRLRARYVKLHGTALGFLCVFSVEVSKSGKVHHHMFLSAHGLTHADILDAWGLGRCRPELLEYDEDGVRGLAHYTVKDPATSRRWYCSAGHRRPEPKKNDTKWSARDMKSLMESNGSDGAYFSDKYYPGWSIREVSYSSTLGGDFCEIELYRTDNAYFYRDRYGRLRRRTLAESVAALNL